MNITVVTEPPVEPLLTSQVYEFLRWDPETVMIGSPPASEPLYPLNDEVMRHIRTARQYVEDETRRALVMQTIQLSTSTWRGIELLRPPFIGLDNVAYINQIGQTTELDLDDFFVTDDYVPKLRAYSRVVEACGDLSCERDDAIRVTYRVGYPPTYDQSSPPEIVGYVANIPSSLIDAMLIKVQLLCDRFDAGEQDALERSLKSIVSSFRVYTW